ncbi:cysteine-rich receptor-like protein kinase 10 isoform X2 [Cajanus cajan]|uniref:cysteine-rich receptor-like protein kinase 10 isoform X2 n=1 Tax=Cajanus cajan TaxID=3821 RepID=UPI00098D9372|nr:cysteine-rich receptor-like protein kinase 10 isoform X2 [Cajanus cajan]
MGAVTVRPMLVLFLSCLYLRFISEASAQPDVSVFCDYNQVGNYTSNSTYGNNLNTLLTTLSSNKEIDYGFYNMSYGQEPNRVNAIGMCRGDVEPEQCRSCLNDSRGNLTRQCPNQKEAILFYDNCMLRYSNRTIFGVMETGPALFLWNVENATNIEQFNQVLGNLLKNLTARAASGDSRHKYATQDTTAANFQAIYSLLQCTPDLSSLDCNNCLTGAITDIPTYCNGRRGCRVIRPSCNVRFENYLFYKVDPQPPPPPPPPTNHTSQQESSNTIRIVIAVTVPTVTVVVVVILIGLCRYLRRRKTRKSLVVKEEEEEIKIAESLQFKLDTIRVATGDFSDSNKLGQGGFGAVYWGKLSNEQMIAVKRLSSDSGQGDTEFKNEVLLLAKLQHRNLVRLLGFCLEGRERLLVYEFVPNKSLDYFIFDPTMKSQLDWEMRYKIIRDEEMNPKIADFGMARLVLVDQTQVNTRRIVGTYGYMAPEYAMHGQFSVKSDVFSFGVLILEIVSGHKNSGIRNQESFEDLLSFAWKNWKEGTALNIVDPSLNNNSRNEMMRSIHIGLLCVQENSSDRPTMATIMLMLNSYSLSLPIPTEPAFYINSRTRSLPSMQSWEYNSRETGSSEPILKSTQESLNEASITELYPR